MRDHPLRLLLLLRSSPLVPFTPLNLYAGATDRFTFGAFACTFLGFAPLAYVFVGVGGAILKFRLIARGMSDDEKYLPWLWTALSLSIVFVLVLSAASLLAYRRAKAKRAEGAVIAMHTTGGPTTRRSTTGSRFPRSRSKIGDEERGSLVDTARGGAVEPPPPPPPPPDEDMPPGWREVLSDDGELYYFNDETGESQWDRPGGTQRASEAI